MLPRSHFRFHFIVACLFFTNVASAQGATNDLQALYDFQGSGEIVKDRSGNGIDLRIENVKAVKRRTHELEIHSATIVRTVSPPRSLVAAIKRSREFTVEAWVMTSKDEQAGPARIVTLSENTGGRNFTLGQDGTKFDIRFRTSKTDSNGLPSVSATYSNAKSQITHVAYTRDAKGMARLFLNGRMTKEQQVSGDLNNWSDGFQLALANEITMERPWLGKLYLVAIYSRALNVGEINLNWKAGHGANVESAAKPANPSAMKVAITGPARVGRGLVALYDFQDQSGDLVRDRAGTGTPLDLKIAKPSAVKRKVGVLQITGDTTIESMGLPERVVRAIQRSNSLTIEAWVRPGNLQQKGPARIVTISRDANQRNVTLGQEGNQFEARLRTTETSVNGIPSIRSAPKSVKTKLTHVAYTRDRSGNARLFVDGQPGKQEHVPGATSNWSDEFRIAIGNEFSGGRLWKGEFHLVAIYSRNLKSREIQQNFKAGPNGSTEPESLQQAPDPKVVFFESKVAPLLSQRCLECHDSAAPEGGLDLSRKIAALKGGDSGVAFIAGNSGKSLLWQSVEDDSMPHERPPLNAEEKEVLKGWIDGGAVWPIDYVDPAIYRSVGRTENWVQRLTIPEYIATVQATFGVDVSAEAERLLPQDKRADGFRNTAYNLSVDLKHVEGYAKLAELIVAKFDVQEFAKRFSRKRLLTDDSMRDLIAKMGKWVLRGPLDEREVVVYRGISTTVASAGGDFEEAVRLVLEAMLQSPRFIYRIEDQRGDEELPIGDYELASRISYIIWGASPDQKLIDAAETGELSDSNGIRQQIDRMLQDPRAKQRSEQFVIEWLNLDRLYNIRPNAERFPNWDASLAADMRTETIQFFQHLVWERRTRLSELLNAQFTFATPRLAKHYGMPALEEGWKQYDLAEIESRGGLLTHGSVLTIGGDDASMVTRGLFVLNDLLFSEVGDPPPGLDVTPVPTSPGRTHRAIAAERVASESCGGCHSRFEPLAYGLEKFDGLGAFHQRDEHGNELREDGEILFPGDAKPVSYQSSAEMMDLLANSDRVSQCITRKLAQFSLGRPLIAEDAAIIRDIHQAAKTKNSTYQSILAEIILSDLVQTKRSESE